ncbi:MAG: OmpA family protein [Polyangia bacterium]
MLALAPGRQAVGAAHPVAPGLRTAVAIGLLVMATLDLAAIDAILLPRYLGGRGRAANLVTIRAPAHPELGSRPIQVTPTPANPPSAPLTVAAPAPLPSPPSRPAAAAARPAPTAARPAPAEMVWPKLQFAPSQAGLSAAARATLASLAARLEREGKLRVRLDGHTDDSGTAELNRSLSLERALRARAWLVAHGVESAQLTVRGHGSSKPLAQGRSASAREQNRRVEITLQEGEK